VGLTHFSDFKSALGKLRRKLSICKQFVNKLFDPQTGKLLQLQLQPQQLINLTPHKQQRGAASPNLVNHVSLTKLSSRQSHCSFMTNNQMPVAVGWRVCGGVGDGEKPGGHVAA